MFDLFDSTLSLIYLSMTQLLKYCSDLRNGYVLGYNLIRNFSSFKFGYLYIFKLVLYLLLLTSKLITQTSQQLNRCNAMFEIYDRSKSCVITHICATIYSCNRLTLESWTYPVNQLQIMPIISTPQMESSLCSACLNVVQ